MKSQSSPKTIRGTNCYSLSSPPITVLDTMTMLSVPWAILQIVLINFTASLESLVWVIVLLDLALVSFQSGASSEHCHNPHLHILTNPSGQIGQTVNGANGNPMTPDYNM